MKVDFAFICDYAEATGKLNALGIGFDTIYALKLPATHPHFSLVVQLRTSIVEAGQKRIKVSIIDEDGKDVIPPIESQFNIPKPEGALESIGRFILDFGNVQFKRHGSYSTRVDVEGVELSVLPFRVAQPPSGTR